MNLLAVFTLHFAVFAQALVKVDWAITGYDGATLGDCAYSLLHENKLGAKWIYSYSPREVVSVCHNEQANKCDSKITGWTPYDCVQRYDVYYHDGHAPEPDQYFFNFHGSCFYHPFSTDAGGKLHTNQCRCSAVGELDQCQVTA